MSLSAALQQRGIVLPPIAVKLGWYMPAKREGSLIYVSGQVPLRDGKLVASGRVPSQCSIEQAQQAARQCVINGLAAVAALPGGLDVVRGAVRLGVFVCSDDGFGQQPEVANAASEMLVDLFGDAGRHTRAAVGVPALPLGSAVEIEFLFHA